jgi:Ca2+-binding EF-hand superfamily protein
MLEKLNTDALNFEQFLDLMSARISDIDSRDDLRNVFALFSDGGDFITVDNLLRVAKEVRVCVAHLYLYT